MSDLQITDEGNGHDLLLTDGDFTMIVETETDDGDAVVQRVTYTLSTWQGESVYDRAAGIPYLDGVFGVGPVPGISTFLTQQVLDTDGVAAFDEEPSYTLVADRVLNQGIVVVTDKGIIRRLSLEIQPL